MSADTTLETNLHPPIASSRNADASADFYAKINEAFIRCVEQNVIRDLNLFLHKFDDHFTCLLADALKHNTSVLRLTLELNEISDIGAVALADALGVNETIKEVNISRNRIGPVGMKALAQGPMRHNRSIVSWDLTDNAVPKGHPNRLEIEKDIIRALWDHRAIFFYGGPGKDVVQPLVDENRQRISELAQWVTEGMSGQ